VGDGALIEEPAHHLAERERLTERVHGYHASFLRLDARGRLVRLARADEFGRLAGDGDLLRLRPLGLRERQGEDTVEEGRFDAVRVDRVRELDRARERAL